MASDWKTFGEALVTFINGQSDAEVYSEAITAERRNVVDVSKENCTSLRCFVAPINRSTTQGTRAYRDHILTYGIYLCEVVSGGSVARLSREDKIIELSEEILSSIAPETDIGGHSFQLPDEEQEAINPELYRDHNIAVIEKQIRFLSFS